MSDELDKRVKNSTIVIVITCPAGESDRMPGMQGLPISTPFDDLEFEDGEYVYIDWEQCARA